MSEACLSMKACESMEEMSSDLWSSVVSDGNLIATAIHDGHEVRPGVLQLLALPSWIGFERKILLRALGQWSPERASSGGGLASRWT